MKVGEPTWWRYRVVEAQKAHHDCGDLYDPPIESIPRSEGNTRSVMKAEEEGKRVGDCWEEVGVFHIKRNHGEGSNEVKE